MIIETKKVNGITTYIVDKNITDKEMESRMNRFVDKNDINIIINHSCDVYTKDGDLLMRFRKRLLLKKIQKSFMIILLSSHTTLVLIVEVQLVLKLKRKM